MSKNEAFAFDIMNVFICNKEEPTSPDIGPRNTLDVAGSSLSITESVILFFFIDLFPSVVELVESNLRFLLPDLLGSKLTL